MHLHALEVNVDIDTKGSVPETSASVMSSRTIIDLDLIEVRGEKSSYLWNRRIEGIS